MISTHAPAGGATAITRPRLISSSISTHAPAGGATGEYPLRWTGKHLFLLTPLREGRLLNGSKTVEIRKFLLTPLREGRR